MRIVHVMKMTGIAGAENHLKALLPGLCTHGFTVALLILTDPRRNNRDLERYADDLKHSHGIDAQLIPIRSAFDPRLIRTLIRLFRGADAVHTHLIHADLHGLIAARIAGVKYVFSTAHNDDQFRRRRVIRLFQRWYWSQVTAGIAISDSLRHFLLSVESAPPSKIHSVRYGYSIQDGVDESRVTVGRLRTKLGLAPDVPIFGSVCRLVPQKGLDTAIRAFARIADDYPKASYVIIGDGTLRSKLSALARDLQIADRVHFWGWDANPGDLYPDMTCFVMPSRWEGFGLVALEAMAHQLPILASNVSALPEILEDGRTGILFPVDDVDQLAAAMRRILDDPAQAAAMGGAGYARARDRFSVEAMIEGTLYVYGSVISAGG